MIKYAILLFTSFAFFKLGHCQFSNINLNESSQLNFVKISDSDNLCVIGSNNIYKSTDQAITFTQILNSSYFPNTMYNSAIIVNNQTIFAVGQDNALNSGKIIVTTDGGTTWNTCYQSTTGDYKYLKTIYKNGNTIIAAGGSTVIRSTDNGSTWNSQTLSMGVNGLTFVAFDNITNKWILIGGNRKFYSIDDGISWTSVTTPSSLTYSSIDVNFNQKTELNLYYGQNTIYSTNGATNETDSIEWNDFSLSKAISLPNGKILSYSANKFYLADTVVDDVYYLHDSIHGSFSTTRQSIRDIAAGNNFVIAVGTIGAIGVWRYSDPLAPYLPATFSVYNNINSCPNSAYYAIPIKKNGDTYNWYKDGVLISTNDTLTDYLPNTASTTVVHNITLELGVQDNSNSSTQAVTLSTTSINYPSYTFQYDSTLCGSQTPAIQFNGIPSSSSETIQFLQIANNTIITPTSITTQSSSQKTYYFSNIHTSDSILIKINYSYCPNQPPYTKLIYFQSSNDLVNPIQIVGGTILKSCFDHPQTIELTNSQNNYSYQLHYGSYTPFHTFTGVLNDTVSVVTLPIVGQNLQVNITTNFGCTLNNITIGNIINGDPNATFSLTDQYNLINDTVAITTTNQSYSDSWSIDPSGSVFGVNPNFYCTSNQIGEQNIEHIVETTNACSDTTTGNIYFGTPLNNPEHDFCFIKSIKGFNLIDSELDHLGNIIQIGWTGFYNSSIYTNAYVYVIRKIDQNGNLIWEKSINQNNLNNIYTATLTSLAIDANNNIYTTLHVSIDEDNYFQFETINLVSTNYLYGTIGNYLVKFDSDGNWETAKNLNLIDGNFTDLILENDIFYASFVYSQNWQYAFSLYSIDLLGNVLTSKNVQIFGNSINPPQYNLLSSVNYGQVFYKSPQIRKLNNGNIAIEGYCSGISGSSPYFIENGIHYDLPTKSSFIILYNNNFNFINYKIISQNTIQNTISKKPDFQIDDDNNIYLMGNWDGQNNVNDSLKIMGVFHEDKGGSYIIKLDPNLNVVWQKMGGNNRYTDIHLSDSTLFLIGSTFNNLAFETNPNTFEVLENDFSTLNRTSLFYAKYDLNGHFIESNMMNLSGLNVPSTNISIVSNLNELGDLYFTCTEFNQQYEPIYLNYFDQSIMLDSAFILKLNLHGCKKNYFDLSTNDSLNICSFQDISINYQHAIYLDSIQYDIYDGAQLIQCGIDNILDSTLDFTLNNNLNNFTFITNFEGTYFDTTFIQLTQLQPPLFDFDSTMCINNSQTISVLSTEMNVYFNNNESSTLSYFLTADNNAYPSQLLPIKIVYPNDCIRYDTIQITLNKVQQTFSFDSIMCIGDEQIIAINPLAIQHYWNGDNQENDSLLITANNTGNYTITLHSIDSNNCELHDTLTYDVYVPIIPTLQSQYYLNLGFDLTLTLPSSEFSSAFWTNGTNALSTTFLDTSLIDGSNYVSVLATDIHHCISVFDFTIFYNTASVDELQSKNINLYPNPTRGTFYINAQTDDYQDYEITNIAGQKVKTGKINSMLTEIDLNSISDGIYYVLLKGPELRDLKTRIIKSH